MPMCDKVIADTQELARSKPAKVAEIEKQRAPLEHEIHEKPGIFEGIVDKRRIKVTRHDARLNLYGSSVQYAAAHHLNDKARARELSQRERDGAP
jgi:hypothetical protein